MGIGSWWHWLIVLIVVLVLFGGGGKIPRLMGDLAKGIKSFKSGMKDDKAEDEAGTPAAGEAPKRVAESDRPSTTGQEKNAANS